ncbi:T9SS type A sorting domain-containing protein [bacterium]|nr:T9SS type A sorting domain-containing protein [bacterium]
MVKRRSIALVLGVLVSSLLIAAPRMLPTKPDVMPEFHVPRENSRALDENWVYVQTLYDASQFAPDYWGAVPVGFAKANQTRAFLATLHTIFRTLDGGRTWTNLDPQPAPTPSPVFQSLRHPRFISDITWRPVRRTELNADSIYIAVYDVAGNGGILRLIRGFGSQHVLWPADSLNHTLESDRWLTGIAAPDSNIAVALAGLDARIYRNDSMLTSVNWDTLPERFTGTWVSEVTTMNNFIYAVGSNQWLSLDRGFSWQQLPAADPLGDRDIDFAPNSGHAIVCGGSEDPSSGWVRYTNDFGQTWSPRTLQTNIPLNTVLLLNDTLGYCAGGSAEDAIGRVWRTTDGGATWELELEVEAEITELGYARESGGYINVIAAGYFADFRCGVWRSHLQFPDTTGPAIVLSNDTLTFYAAAGETMVQEVALKNVGDANVSIFDMVEAGPFTTSCCAQDILLLPGDSTIITVTFVPGIEGEYANSLRILTEYNEYVALEVIGTTFSSAEPRATLPQELSLSVYPNPGNAEFRLSYSLTKNSAVSLTLFDITGREVATLVDGVRNAGEHVVHWSANAQPSGVYFAVLNAGESRRVSKLVLLK